MELIDGGLELPRFIGLHGVNTCSFLIAEGSRNGANSVSELLDDAVDQFSERDNIVLQFDRNFAICACILSRRQ